MNLYFPELGSIGQPTRLGGALDPGAILRQTSRQAVSRLRAKIIFELRSFSAFAILVRTSVPSATENGTNTETSFRRLWRPPVLANHANIGPVKIVRTTPYRLSAALTAETPASEKTRKVQRCLYPARGPPWPWRRPRTESSVTSTSDHQCVVCLHYIVAIE